jgi:hypothetical protein
LCRFSSERYYCDGLRAGRYLESTFRFQLVRRLGSMIFSWGSFDERIIQGNAAAYPHSPRPID